MVRLDTCTTLTLPMKGVCLLHGPFQVEEIVVEGNGWTPVSTSISAICSNRLTNSAKRYRILLTLWNTIRRTHKNRFANMIICEHMEFGDFSSRVSSKTFSVTVVSCFVHLRHILDFHKGAEVGKILFIIYS